MVTFDLTESNRVAIFITRLLFIESELPMSNEKNPTLEELFGDVIHVYSREQAIADGVLVDLSKIAPKVCGEVYNLPIAVTAAVWSIIDKAVKNERACNDLDGVVWDILYMSRVYAKRDAQSFLFPVIITGAGRKRNHTFKMVISGGDNGEPVLTIMEHH